VGSAEIIIVGLLAALGFSLWKLGDVERRLQS
jgi:hypothetical protein